GLGVGLLSEAVLSHSRFVAVEVQNFAALERLLLIALNDLLPGRFANAVADFISDRFSGVLLGADAFHFFAAFVNNLVVAHSVLRVCPLSRAIVSPDSPGWRRGTAPQWSHALLSVERVTSPPD